MCGSRGYMKNVFTFCEPKTIYMLYVSGNTKQRLCINLEAWDGEGDGRGSLRGELHIYLWLIHVGFDRKQLKKFCKQNYPFDLKINNLLLKKSFKM